MAPKMPSVRKNTNRAKARDKKMTANKPTSGNRSDTIIGKTIIGELYFDTGHGCVPWVRCERCTAPFVQLGTAEQLLLAAAHRCTSEQTQAQQGNRARFRYGLYPLVKGDIVEANA